MKNTVIPLDMLFLDSSGKIIDIHERAVPFSTDIIAAKVPSRYVIELNGSYRRAARHQGRATRLTSPVIGK